MRIQDYIWIGALMFCAALILTTCAHWAEVRQMFAVLKVQLLDNLGPAVITLGGIFLLLRSVF